MHVSSCCFCCVTAARPRRSCGRGARRTGHWVWGLKFERVALKETLTDVATEVDHLHHRITRREVERETATAQAPAAMRAVIDALQALRGVSKRTAVTLATEVGTLTRFEPPRQLMGYSGVVPSKHSSGGKSRRGAITKTGNRHRRRVLVEAAWSYRHGPRVHGALRKRQEALGEPIKEIAWKARHRLHKRCVQLAARGKPHPQVVTAVARELLGFVWAIGVHVERARAA